MFDIVLKDNYFIRTIKDSSLAIIKKALLKVLIYCVYWGLGTHLKDES